MRSYWFPKCSLSSLSILHNIWKNDCNPIFDLVLDSAKTKEGKNTWAREADRILKQYQMPTINDLFNMRCPEKEAWKSYRKEKLEQYWSKHTETEISKMISARFAGPLPTKLNKKLSANLKGVYTKSDMTATNNMINIMCDNMETGVNLKHRGKTEDDKCHHCS